MFSFERYTYYHNVLCANVAREALNCSAAIIACNTRHGGG